MNTMLYKAPGPHEIHGGRFDYLIVEDDKVEDALADGWHLTTPEAKAAHEASIKVEPVHVQPGDTVQIDGVTDGLGEPVTFVAPESVEITPPTRDEIEQKASELGIKFDGRWGDKKLADAIVEKLKA